ncbi:MAG: hypothetical protein P0Y55_04860 [Candidatus Cohnella colombiensis]|uniref:Uncharacterized protein n=1 Tax=Candidatus Cohnella colombiensis TaxID=3121368 RepID=A0AA95F0G5_9BACL|nr:MAG: hypothetical protein P0Y55_04860 [Cohnella sp.]
MRQSRKEANLKRMIQEGLLPERREAVVISDSLREEYSDDPGATASAVGRRFTPGGRS